MLAVKAPAFLGPPALESGDRLPSQELDAARGGRTRLSPRRYLTGAPELIAEIAASSATIDLHDKMDTYARSGVGEYLVWRTREERFDWFLLEKSNYVTQRADRRGRLHSRAFPGLVLDPRALLAMDAPKVLKVLQRSLMSAAHRRFVARLQS